MDKDRIVGSGKQIKGAVKQVVGKAVGDVKLESEGKADKIEGKVQNTLAASKTRSKVNSRIIRNQILPDAPLSYSGVNQAHFPALISAAGRQELCAWIERVQIAYNGGTLTDRGLTPLRPYLVPLAQEDRVSILRILLSQDARNFLTVIRARWGKALFTD